MNINVETDTIRKKYASNGYLKNMAVIKKKIKINLFAQEIWHV